MDAPVVLIYGTNGSGKTSLLSALELALTGAIPSLRRVERDYLQHLPHKEAIDGRGKVELDVTGLDGRDHAKMIVTKNSVENDHLLSSEMASFFSERCYLAQSTLARLLEIYQQQDARKTDSPLTRFVKDLLGLDEFDALVDGLRTVEDVRRLREPVPAYWSARQDIPELEDQLRQLFDELTLLESREAAIEQRIRGLLVDLLPNLPAGRLNLSAMQTGLSTDEDETALLLLARVRRDLTTISQQWRSIAAGPATENRQSIEKADMETRGALHRWTADVGAALDRVVSELQTSIPDLKTTATANPDAVRVGAAQAVDAELRRIANLLTRDEAEEKRISGLQQSIDQGNARMVALDQKISEAAGVNEGLAQALSEIAPHIHNDNCPVCGRNFSEISTLPLSAHLSARIAELVETAGRLQALSRDKAATAGAIGAAERELGTLTARRLTSAERDDLKKKRARFDELRLRLAGLQEGTDRGASLVRRAAFTSSRLTELRNNDQVATLLRQSLATSALQLSQPPIGMDESVEVGSSRLQRYVEERERLLVERQRIRRSALEEIEELRKERLRLEQVRREIVTKDRKLQPLKRAKFEADRRIDLAKELAKRTRDRRTNIIRQVFNDELNAVWRDLFVRLAPDELFVPAFALPQTLTGPVEAILETHYRPGGKGGNPRAMLSAGNLNTAALTLFLALHLSQKPMLPWLIIDDPVQSMDEVHIAQFAALLRTLSKQKDRQVVIAVHERPLFEYLTLELSPAYLDDRLITVELAKSHDGMTTAVWKPRTYEPDRAIAA